MAQLIVRNLPEELVKALKRRAAARNRSAEQEHREILEFALRSPKRRLLADVLAAIPDVGSDGDFDTAAMRHRPNVWAAGLTT